MDASGVEWFPGFKVNDQHVAFDGLPFRFSIFRSSAAPFLHPKAVCMAGKLVPCRCHSDYVLTARPGESPPLDYSKPLITEAYNLIATLITTTCAELCC